MVIASCSGWLVLRTGSVARAFAALARALVAHDVMASAAIASGVWFRGG